MIEKIKKIPVTKESHPFATAVKKCDFPGRGYVEDEYFMYGTANLYEADENEQVSVIYKDAPYVNRFLVRRPEAAEQFSGRVVIEILNATALIDLDRIWVNTRNFLMRRGDIYVGITSKPDVVPALKRFDGQRYGEIAWENPMPQRGLPDNPLNFPADPATETGLFWDMLVDLAKLLRQKDEQNPISAYGKAKLYLAGWSQSVGYLQRILRSFAYLPQNCENGPLFDGYFHAGAGTKPAPANLYGYGRYFSAKDGRSRFFYNDQAGITGAREPYIAVNTESENMDVNWAGDSDVPGALFRAYEIPGSTHDTVASLLTYYENDEDTEKIGMTPTYGGCDPYPNDYPCEVVFHSALEHLYRWSDGIRPPRAPRIEKDKDRVNCTDAFGNALGGIRTAALEFPTARYYNYSHLADGRCFNLFGHIQPFSPAFLKELYQNAANYRRLVTAHTEKMAALGFILPEDADGFVELLVSKAVERGLPQ